MQYIVFILLFFVFLSPSSSLAQEQDDVEINLDVLQDYTPPDMFSSQSPSKQPPPLKRSGNMRVLGPDPLLPPTPPAIEAEAPDLTPEKPSAPPPLPPKRPTSFKVPQAYIENVLGQNDADKKKTTKTKASANKKPAQNGSSPTNDLTERYQNDYLGRDLVDMSAQDVLHSLDGTEDITTGITEEIAEEITEDISTPVSNLDDAAPSPAIEHNNKLIWPLVIPFTAESYELPPELKNEIKDRILPYMQRYPEAQIRIDTYAQEPADSKNMNARRISLARALAIRQILQEHGIKEDRTILRASGVDEAAQNTGKVPDRAEITPLP